MDKNKIIIAFLLVALIASICYTSINKSLLKQEVELNKTILLNLKKEQNEKKQKITNDSIRYVSIIDSISKEVVIINKKRINERNKLQQQISKINNFVDSNFVNYNDSLKVCCTNNTN